MFVDVHDRLLFYAVCAWEETFTGYVIDYGTFPEQRRSAFTLADATRTLGRAFPGAGVDGAIQAGLEQLVSAYLGRDWSRGGSLMRIDRLLVDMGYKPGIVADVKQKAGGAAMMLAKGVGIRASRKPIAEYARRPGETIGHYWYIPNVRKTGQFPHVLVDVNYWKRFVHEGLATAAGDRGCISLFGKDGRQHELFAEHVARSEKWVEVIGPGGVVREWSPLADAAGQPLVRLPGRLRRGGQHGRRQGRRREPRRYGSESGTRRKTCGGRTHGRTYNPAKDVGPSAGQTRLGVPVLRMQAFPRHLHPPGMGRKDHAPARVSAMRKTAHYLGEHELLCTIDKWYQAIALSGPSNLHVHDRAALFAFSGLRKRVECQSGFSSVDVWCTLGSTGLGKSNERTDG